MYTHWLTGSKYSLYSSTRGLGRSAVISGSPFMSAAGVVMLPSGSTPLDMPPGLATQPPSVSMTSYQP